MDLDEMKQQWEGLTNKQIPSALSTSFPKNKINVPVTSLKAIFIIRLIAIPLSCAYIISILTKQHDIFATIIVFFIVPIGVLLLIYFYVSYRLLTKLQRMESPVRLTLEKHIEALEKMIKWKLIIINVSLLIFIIILETVVFFVKNQQKLPDWFHYSFWIRFASYILALGCSFLYSKYFSDFKYRGYIKSLKILLLQTS